MSLISAGVDNQKSQHSSDDETLLNQQNWQQKGGELPVNYSNEMFGQPLTEE